MEESIRMTEDRDKWRMYVHGVANPRIETAEEQNRTVSCTKTAEPIEMLFMILNRVGQETTWVQIPMARGNFEGGTACFDMPDDILT